MLGPEHLKKSNSFLTLCCKTLSGSWTLVASSFMLCVFCLHDESHKYRISKVSEAHCTPCLYPVSFVH